MDGYPTMTTLALFAVVFLTQVYGTAVGLSASVFTLALPLDHQPWTLVVSVYAHADLRHLAANTIALAVVGPAVAYLSTPLRYHAFFVVSGALAGIAQVAVMAPFGSGSVIGASGAIFGLFGYLLVGNPASNRVLSWVSLGFRGTLLIFGVLGGLLTLATASPGVALVAHFTGFLVGAVAGRYRLLHATSPEAGDRNAETA
ncbi:rhomboid family intramembrane serine protease [Natronomonas halophila]|uniref:rhomboid family intramembrane serine protease n=1 Tax=Natronomonas halophila TaxID=2747817 RepID=UPI0015B76E44|nr:rhomboid family intramembrane serine protease [Natronomonas halophila]QLD84467.1 rhomboid family intramembrane serine protease [Natronomonas halophila]